MIATQVEIKADENTDSTKKNGEKSMKESTSALPWWLQPELLDEDEKEEKKLNSLEESLQKKSDISLAPVTLNFVGIRPSKLHLQNKQISTICLNKNTSVSCIKIKFNALTLHDSVHKLKQLLFAQFAITQTRQSILIHYGHTKLSLDEELLYNYGITDNCVLLLAIYDNQKTAHKDNFMCISAQNPTEEEISRLGKNRRRRDAVRKQRDIDAVKRRLQRINDLRNGKKLQLQKSDAAIKHIIKSDIITLKKLLATHKNMPMVKGFDIISQETNVCCLKLPICGHLLGPRSLYEYGLAQFINREEKVKCPHTINTENHTLCDTQWDYPLIKQCLMTCTNTTDSASDCYDFNKLELLSARNSIQINYDLQKCPDCATLFYRNARDNNFECKMQCPLCVDCVFCWGCNEKWLDNHECDTSFRAATMQILSSCAMKKVGPAKQCPSVRACPKCNQLINHVSACKHIKCTFCKTNFCFICLKPMQNGKWKCGGYSDLCQVGKRQNYSLLPKLNKLQASFAMF